MSLFSCVPSETTKRYQLGTSSNATTRLIMKHEIPWSLCLAVCLLSPARLPSRA